MSLHRRSLPWLRVVAPRSYLRGLLLVQPDVLEAPAVEHAVDHDFQPLQSRLPACRKTQVIDDRARLILLQPAIDLPDQALALLLVGFHRLLLEQLLQLGVAVAGVIALRATREIFIELGVRIIGADPGQIEAELVILAVDLGVPAGCVDGFELAVDKDLLQLIDQNDRRVAENRDIARRYLDGEPPVGAVAELLQDLASLGAVLFDIGTIARQAAEDFRRKPPHSFGRRLHRPAYAAGALRQDVN